MGHLDLAYLPYQFPIAMSYILGREVKNLGPHVQFFSRNEGTKILLYQELANQLLGFRSEQVDLRVFGHVYAVTNRAIALWSEGNDSTPIIDLPDALLRAVENGLLLVALLDQPRVDWQPPESAFTRTWHELMPNPIIPYDQEARRGQFSHAYQQLAPLIEKWRWLRTLGHAEIRRRFPRGWQSQERR